MPLFCESETLSSLSFPVAQFPIECYSGRSLALAGSCLVDTLAPCLVPRLLSFSVPQFPIGVLTVHLNGRWLSIPPSRSCSCSCSRAFSACLFDHLFFLVSPENGCRSIRGSREAVMYIPGTLYAVIQYRVSVTQHVSQTTHHDSKNRLTCRGSISGCVS